jgi:hypothetical protein
MDDLLKEISTYCAQRKISWSTFGNYAVSDGKFVDRLSRGGQCLPTTAQRARAYMAENPPKAEKSPVTGGVR